MEPIKADTFLEYQFPGRVNFNPSGTRVEMCIRDRLRRPAWAW